MTPLSRKYKLEGIAMEQALAGGYGIIVSVPRRRWNRFAFSLALHGLGLLLLPRLTLWTPQWQPIRIAHAVTLMAPAAAARTETPPPPKLRVAPVQQIAELNSIEPVRLPARNETPPLVERMVPRPSEETAPLPAPALSAPKLAPQVQMGTLGGGGSAPKTIDLPKQQVQTGGFGDPNGLRGVGRSGARLTAASVGEFDLPRGDGYGNGTGGAHGSRGTIASTGFGNGVAGPGSGSAKGQGTVIAAGFADRAAGSTAAPHARKQETAPALTPVEIIAKPRPAYTDDARRLGLEGEVLLEVVFQANGQLRVVRVVRGLGHGLDEAALHAAEQIRFRPAQRDGQPVESTATVHIVFELAN